MKAIAGNVTAKLIDLTEQQRRDLDRTFAIRNQALFFVPQLRRLIMSGRMDDRVHFFNPRNDTIPTGLLPKVVNMYPDLVIEREITPDQWKIWERAKNLAQVVEVNGISYRDDQRPAIVSAMENMRGILKCATNFGKTPIGAGIIKCLNVPSLWVIHRKALLQETSDRVEEYLQIPVGKIGAGIKKTGTLVTVGVDKSIVNMGSKWLEQFECVIFDEAQHLSCKTQQDIAAGCINAPWRIAMSGSFPKDKLKIFHVMAAADSTLLYEVTNKELISAGISATPEVYVKTLRYPALVNGMPLYGFDWQDAQEYCLYKNEFFHNVVAADAEKWIDQNYTVFVFAGDRKQGQAICQKLSNKQISNEFIDFQTPDFARKELLRKFGRKQLAVIVSVNTLTEGIDLPSMGCIIMAAGKKSDIEILQKLGRGVRRKKEGENKVIIQDYNMVGSKYTERHSKARFKIYQKEQFKIINDGELNLG